MPNSDPNIALTLLQRLRPGKSGYQMTIGIHIPSKGIIWLHIVWCHIAIANKEGFVAHHTGQETYREHGLLEKTVFLPKCELLFLKRKLKPWNIKQILGIECEENRKVGTPL